VTQIETQHTTETGEGKMSNIKEETINHRPNANLIGAIIAGVCVGFILAWSRTSGDESYVPELMRITLLAVCSYSAVALLVNQWKRRPLLRIPNWILIAVLGSTVTFLSVNIISDVTSIWRFRNSGVSGSASAAIQEEMIRTIGSTIINSLIALPIMMIVNYIDRALKTRLRPSIEVAFRPPDD
jgi:hypothetical protein